tara:strand:- start:1177 stop:1380 length:204 start_codon:yes stop_codon:yes gene_type:complete
MPVQKIIAIKNRKYSLSLKNEWNYYIFYLIGAKIIKSGPWSQDIAYSLRDDLLINNICAWIKRLNED